MRRVLALILSVSMLTMVAMAAPYSEPAYVQPGDTLTIDSNGDVVDSTWNAWGFWNVIEVTPGLSSLNTKNYSIKKVNYDKGKAHVEKVSLTSDNEEDKLFVSFKEDYSRTTEDDWGKDINFTIELRGKGKNVQDGTVKIEGDYGFGVIEIFADPDGKINYPWGSPWRGGMEWDYHIYKMTDQLPGDNGSSEGSQDGALYEKAPQYGTMEFDTLDSEAVVSVRVYDGDKFFIGQNTDADKKLLVANADTEAEISFLNFYGKPSFNSTATVYFYQVDKDGFIYEKTGEGKIKKSTAKWSEDDDCWVLKTRALGSYVFSDKALASDAAAEDTATNPETGATNVFGIASAVAAVSLMAAGALTLKK
ncbi:MAG: hypothetical protein VB100_12990 [Angelakisella sp.]|nr:hypothetical protein [Angelakisella sp.]